jgi:hypothetical protein
VSNLSDQAGEGRDITSGRFKKGGAGGPGRPPGSRNMSTAMLREAFLNAFDNLGGEEWLVAQARKDPRTFVRCVAKMLPREATIKTDGPSFKPLWPDNMTPEQEAKAEAKRAKCLELARQAAQAAGMGTGLGGVAQFLLMAGLAMPKPPTYLTGGGPA